MKTILNPFLKYSEKLLVSVGILFLLLGGYAATLVNGRFDGVIDLHFVENVTFYQPFIDLIISITSVTIILFVLGKYINEKTRFIDILATSLIAKIPFYFLLFFNINSTIFIITEKMMLGLLKDKNLNLELSDTLILIASAVMTLLFLVWTIILLFNGFKTATNAKERKHYFLFAIAILISEILSKIIISTLN